MRSAAPARKNRNGRSPAARGKVVALTRRTGQREAIRRAVQAAAGPLSAHDVLDAAQAEVPGLGIATVYRNLKALVDEGWLAQIDLPGEPSRYELAGKDHHHHFQCDGCGRVLDVPGCPRDIRRVTPRSFRVQRHELLLYGRCPDCA